MPRLAFAASSSILVLAMLAVASPSIHATGVTDNFESYAIGSFPAPTWLDVGSFQPGSPAPALPTASVVATTDAFGQPTRALATSDQFARSGGIYQAVAVSSHYALAADIRIDRYADRAADSASDWAMQLSFARLDLNFAVTAQAGVYASTLTQDWRLFLIDSTYTLVLDVPLGVAAPLGRWTRVGFELDATTGAYRVQLGDIASGTSLLDSSGSFAGWLPGSGVFDAVSFFDGEQTPGQTLANLAMVDNINVSAVPEPATWALLLLGSVLLSLRRVQQRR